MRRALFVLWTSTLIVVLIAANALPAFAQDDPAVVANEVEEQNAECDKLLKKSAEKVDEYNAGDANKAEDVEQLLRDSVQQGCLDDFSIQLILDDGAEEYVLLPTAEEYAIRPPAEDADALMDLFAMSETMYFDLERQVLIFDTTTK